MARALVVLLLVGCHPYVTAGYGARGGGNGPLAQLSDEIVARQTAGSGVTVLPAAKGRDYAVAMGAGVPAFKLELGIQPQNFSGDALSFSPSSRRFVSA